MIRSILAVLLSTSSLFANCDDYDYEESEGILVIETENLAYHSDWVQVDTLEGFTGVGYIQWEGVQNYNKVENGIIDFKIKINTPGTYTFLHHVAIADLSEGTTEHNDSWLKIEGDDFYADRDGALVYPRPLCETDDQKACPEGRSDQGYFKMYGGNSSWVWKGNTNDGSAHQVYATFNQAGVYNVSIAARSSYQSNDRMVLFHSSVDKKTATDLNLAETPCTATTSLIPVELPNSIQIENQVVLNPSKLELKVVDVRGQVILSSSEASVSLVGLAQGEYYLRVEGVGNSVINVTY